MSCCDWLGPGFAWYFQHPNDEEVLPLAERWVHSGRFLVSRRDRVGSYDDAAVAPEAFINELEPTRLELLKKALAGDHVISSYPDSRNSNYRHVYVRTCGVDDLPIFVGVIDRLETMKAGKVVMPP